MSTAAKIAVTPEGREGVYIPDRESLKAWIREQGFKSIHNFGGSTGPMVIGADHSVESVIEDIDRAVRVGLLVGDARRNNLNHALALIMPPDPGATSGPHSFSERLEMYDVGEVTVAGLAVETP